MSATTATGLDSNLLNTVAYRDMSTGPGSEIPPRRLSLIPAMYKVEDKILHASEMSQSALPPTFHVDDKILQASELALQQQQRQFQARPDINILDSKSEASTRLEPPVFQQYMPRLYCRDAHYHLRLWLNYHHRPLNQQLVRNAHPHLRLLQNYPHLLESGQWCL